MKKLSLLLTLLLLPVLAHAVWVQKNNVDGSMSFENGAGTKALSVDSVGHVNVLGSQLVTLTATGSITAATHGGKVLLMGEVGGDAAATFTLPEATGSGAKYHFKVSVVNTSNYIIAALTTDTMEGVITMLDADAKNTDGFSIDGTDDKLTFNGTTTGGANIGDWIELVDCLDTTWCVSGNVTGSGTTATPAAAT